MQTIKFNLKSDQLDLFMAVHESHLKCMGTEMRKRFTLDHVAKVVWDKKKGCLKVYWDSGEWLHYTRRHEWY